MSEINEELKQYEDLEQIEKFRTNEKSEELEALERRKEQFIALNERYEFLNNELIQTKEIVKQFSTLRCRIFI